MKKRPNAQWISVLCLLSGLAWGGTVSVTPSSKTYLQTELTAGVPVTLPVALSDWGTTNLTVSASGGGSVFLPSVTPVSGAQSVDRTLSLTPLGASGSTIVTVTVSGAGGSSASTNVSLTVTPVPVIANLSATASFNEDDVYTDDFDVRYWGTANLSWSATIVTGSGVLQTAEISGTDRLSRSLVLTPKNNKNGSASVRVIVSDGTRSDTNMVSVTVAAVADPPDVQGLPSTLSFKEDTSTNVVFTVTDLDEGGSGSITSVATVTGGSSSLLSTVNVSGTTLQLVPYANAYGWATVRVVTANNTAATTNTIQVKVQPVADVSAVSSWPSTPIQLDVGGAPASHPFSSVSVSDADHLAYKNGTSNEYLKASAWINNPSILFSSVNGSSTTNLSLGSVPSSVATWVRGLSLYPPESTYAPVGSALTNTLTFVVFGFGSNDMLSVTSTVPVLLTNPNHPPQYIPTVSANSLQEGQTITPFSIIQLSDPDVVHTSFSLNLYMKSGDEGLASLSSSATMHGNQAELATQLQNVGLVAASGVMSTATTNVTVHYVLSDSIAFVTNSVTLTIHQVATAPVINGISELTAFYSISDISSVTSFPTVITYDTDQGGQQMLSAFFTVSSPELGSFTWLGASVTSFTFQGQTDLQNKLRQLVFEPTAGALAIGTSAEVTLALTVVDPTGLTAVNSSTRVLITAVNKPPRILAPQVQPVLLPPGGDLRPFADTTVTNDDPYNVTLTITLDDDDKGSLGNLGGFTYSSGIYSMTGSVSAINASLTNMTYAVSTTYLFPSDDPGGTVFTLEAEDYQIKLGSGDVWVQVQDEPRNHLVTKQVDDGSPGTLRFALAHASNNDVITIALPEYPAVLAMPNGAGPLVLDTSLTIKGPGADLLTISGDANGDGVSDGQLFVVQSRVTMEGLTLSKGHATFGGAVSVAEAGVLTMRACAVTDCEAEEYGGAIDVEGCLYLYGCYFARNRVTPTGFGGGAVSFYTDQNSAIVNTTFASNRVENSGGYGGGAVYVERNAAIINVAVTHCTFAGNADASDNASAVYVVGGGSYATLKNNVFSDFSALDGARNIDVVGEGWIITEGGNICDDTTRTAHLQSGSTIYYLLTSGDDQTEVNPGLGTLVQGRGDPTPFFPLLPGSPAIGSAQDLDVQTDQRGLIRRMPPLDSGAVQRAATERVAVTEIQLCMEPDDKDPFIEVFVPRDGQDVDLSGFKLYVNGVAVHEFGQGMLALTNSVYPVLTTAASVPAAHLLTPGHGVVIAFPKGDVVDFEGFSPLNPTPVVRGSIVTNEAGFAGLVSSRSRGSVSIARSQDADPVLLHTFLTDFIDPDSDTGTNLLDTAHNSIASAPQGHGFAFLPHSSVSGDMFGGWRGQPVTVGSAILLQSPGATVDGKSFGLRNATPVAVADDVTVTEDDVNLLDVLGNDLDADGNDKLVIVDVSTASEPFTNNAAVALSSLGATVTLDPTNSPLHGTGIAYDPRGSATLQALPAGVEILDTFHYEIIDIGSAAIDGIDGGPASNTYVTAKNHRLVTGDSVVLSQVSVSNYNGTFAIEVIDENTFAIPVSYMTAVAELGIWETDGPRNPSERSEGTVTVRVTGVNDAPVVAGDMVTNVTEASTVRIMVRPEFAGTVLSLPSDPVPAPLPNPAHLIDNDSDIDTDDTWQSLRLIGVMGAVNDIAGYSGTPGVSPVTVRSPAHGLTSGAGILIANYGGHPSYNGYHTVTVVDEDTFTIPRFYVDDDSVKGEWVVLDESNRYHAVTDVGATVDLTLRADAREDHIIYDAAASSFLNGLAEGERYTNRFYQAVKDSHGAIGIGPVDVVVVGLNDTPVARPDPEGLFALTPLVNASNTLANVLSEGLDILYTLSPASGATGRIDVQTVDLSGSLTGTVVLADLWLTDEDTPIDILAGDLLANDADIDRLDVLDVLAVDSVSREGAALTLSGTRITYDPSLSEPLQALAREERVIDTFNVTVTDHRTGGTVTSLVAVLVTGLNDTPVARADLLELTEDDVFVFNPMQYPEDTPAMHDFDLDINGSQPDDRMTILVVSNLITSGGARVDLYPLQARYDATVSEMLNQLADWQGFTDVFEYTITDNNFLFVVDDQFYAPTNTAGRILDVLANDRDFTTAGGALTIVDVGPTLKGGTVAVAPDGRHLVYSSPTNAVVEDYFRYVVENAAGDRRSARVCVRSVVPPLNGILSAADDYFAAAYGETVTLDVLANDNMLPAAGGDLVLSTNVIASSEPGQPVLSGNVFTYSATNGLAPLAFTYEVSAGGASVARANVLVKILDRRGTLNVCDDTYSVAPDSAANVLDVLANDNLVGGETGSYRIAGLVELPAFGTAVTNESGTALLYTPNPGFYGVEHLRYVTTDRIGGTGTAQVSVVVGRIDTAVDFFTVAASTNMTAVCLDVLANDRVQPFPTGTLSVVSVSPLNSVIGSASVGGGGACVAFVPSNTVGQMDFVYVVADVTGRSATGTVTVATVPSGLYANADRFLVRGSGAEYEFDVLANDRTYPDEDRELSIVSIGSDSEGPSAGGSVAIENNRLLYTPVSGFIGQERFKYVMTDVSGTASAWVTVSVRPGDLLANEDCYEVFYELVSGETNAQSFTLPVTINDLVQPALGQEVVISGLGIGTNAPSLGGAVTVAEDGLSLLYRPVTVPVTSVVERFTYEISDGGDRRASAAVAVRVHNRVGQLTPMTQDDAFTVSRNSADNVLPVLLNDFVKPGSAEGWMLDSVTSAAYGGTVAISGNNVLYTPADGFVGQDSFSYGVSDGVGGTGSATVYIQVGEMPTLADRFAVLSGTVLNDLDVLANDPLVEDYADEYTLSDVFGATQGGVISLSGTNTVLYSPAPGYVGPYPYEESFWYTVSDDAAGLVTGFVSVVVYEAGSDLCTTTVTVHVQGVNDQPVLLNEPAAIEITDKESALPFTGVTFVEVDQQTLEPVDVEVLLEGPEIGALTDLGAFVDQGGGRYVLTNVTAEEATAQIRVLNFVPAENRIPVPTTEVIRFTVSVTDRKSAAVTDTNTTVAVTAVNDLSVISGTRSGQTVYASVPIRLFSSVTVTDVDDLTLQPLGVSVQMSAPSKGALRNLGSFSAQSNGLYVAQGLTAAEATVQLRQMEYLCGTNVVAYGQPLTNVFVLTVDDGFTEPPVSDGATSVVAYNAGEGMVRTNLSMRTTFGDAVDIWSTFAVVGAPGADLAGTDSGAAVVYRLVPGTTNRWEVWRGLLPAGIDASDRFGSSVAINASWIAVGAVNDETNGVATGAVYVFGRDAGGSNNWGLVARISPTNLAVTGKFGASVALDGDRLAVGAPKATLSNATTPTGALFVYEKNRGGTNAWGEVRRWEPSGDNVTDTGNSVSMSGDWLVAGAPNNRSDVPAGTPRGAVFCLARDFGGADQWGVTQKIVNASITTDDDFGLSVSVDNGLLAVGAPLVNVGSYQLGKVFVYRYSNAWQQAASLSTSYGPGDNPGAEFGRSVSVNKGFLFIAAAGSEYVSSGGAFLYRPEGGGWVLAERFVYPAGLIPGLQYCSAVSFNQDVAIVGTMRVDFDPYDKEGRVYMYRFKFNNAPTVVNPVADQVAEWNEPFAFVVPDGIFADPDVGDTLSVQASLPVAGSGLEVVGMTVTGTPVVVGAIPVQVSAVDNSGASAVDSFSVVALVDGVLLPSTTRTLWNLAHFGKSVADPSQEDTVWGATANGDGDTLNNDQEYAFGGDPNVVDNGYVGLAMVEDDTLHITFVRRKDDPALVYTLQGTTALAPADWFDASALVDLEAAEDIDASLERVTLTISKADAGPVMFFRIVVSQ